MLIWILDGKCFTVSSNVTLADNAENAQNGTPEVAARSKWHKGENKAADLNKKIQQKKEREGDTKQMTKSRYHKK